MKLSDYVFQFIAAQGVKHVFMLPGGGAMHLVDSLGRNKKLTYVCNLHEQACAIAAEAYARVTNNLGVALVTTGPGGTNAITGVAGAWLASTPCLIISGQVKRPDMKSNSGVRQKGQQELDIVTIVKSVTKYAFVVMEPETIRYHLEKAVYMAREGRKGPVWIDIPLDVQAAQIDHDKLRGFNLSGIKSETKKSLSKQVKHTIQILNNSERPVILAGNGVHYAGAKNVLSRLTDILNIPVLTTWAGNDLFADNYPLFIGKPGTLASRGANFAIQNADCLISIGARLDFDVTGFNQKNFARAAKIIVVDIDSAEIKKLQMKVDVPVPADALNFIQEFIKQKKSLKSANRQAWISRCQEWKDKYPVVLPEYWKQNKYVNSYVFAQVLSEELTANDLVIPGSSGSGIDTFWLSFKSKKGQRVFSTGGLGAMGFAIPASIGGCLASGGKRTITVDGDGGFHMNAQELQTVACLKLPIKYFVLNNQGYASIRNMQRNHFHDHLVGCDQSSGLSLPDTLCVAKAYSLATAKLKSHKALRQNIRKILESPGPIVCEVMVDPDQPVAPRASSAVKPDGTIVSKPLEDLWPFLKRDEFLDNMIIPPLEE
ncbi:MAG TPA: thiamine pyrophosphate-binding protein [Smithella sp.]|nr:thiamine pyrophosphate-binding protein [Smithella sp.]